MRSRPPSWPALTRSTPAGSASALRHPGPGGLHLLNGLYDAKLDGQPVLAITGMPYHDLIGTRTQQDVELDKVFADVAALQRSDHGSDPRRERRDLACRTAILRRGVIAHRLSGRPAGGEGDPQRLEAQCPRPHLRRCSVHGAGLPHEADLRAAAEILNDGSEGRDHGRTRRPRRRRAARGGRGNAGAPIIKALLGKAACRTTARYTTGGIGLLGTLPSQEAMETVRHAADRRHVSFPTSSSTRSRDRRAASRSTSTRRASACATRRKSVSSATASDAARRCCRCSSARPTGASSRRRSRGRRLAGALMERAGVPRRRRR